jgi:signal transduction histidine kinase
MSEAGPSETQALVREINDLLTAREDAVEKARQRASDLAHGLKTPLTLMAQIVERMSARRDDGMAEEMHEQISIIRKRVDRQLALARMAAVHTGSTDVTEVTGKLVEIMRRISEGDRVLWETSLPDGLVAAADATDFSEALGNVLDNARKWAKSRVEISSAETADRISIFVDDDGTGVTETERERIRERGRRLDTHDSETGLGLAICSDIVEAYGGDLDIDRSALGGLKVTLTWPRQAQA